MSVTRLLSSTTPPTRAARSAPPAWRPTWAEVDLGAIEHNTAMLKARVRAPHLMAVVKGDGYGHGLLPAARAALRGGADWLAVALIEEGEQLRRAGIDSPVLLLTEPAETAIPALLAARLTPTVYQPEFIGALDEAARERGSEPLAVHLKLDTGMRRVGVPEADRDAAFTRLRSATALRVEGLWSHLACADEPDHPSIALQSKSFAAGVEHARRAGLRPSLLHLCNSAGALALPEEHYDLVRTGIALYGLDPGSGLGHGIGLRPALRWLSRISLVKRLAAGEAVSYGHRWAPASDTILGTVPAGYADGVNRILGGRGEVVVRERRLPIVGRVCMDQFLVDAGEHMIVAGDEVVLIGRQGEVQVSADDWAAWLDTINYEVVCTVGQRVPRVYVGEGA